MNRRKPACSVLFTTSVCVCALSIAGCTGDSAADSGPVVKPAVPVSTIVLRESSPSFQHHTIASIAPWKSERIGFEQAGRVVQVIEPNEMVTGPENNAAGHVLARLDDERFRIAVEAASADVTVAERRRDANRIAIEQRLPTAIRTAEAELQLAEAELTRAERLEGSNSVSRSAVDAARTGASTARLRVASARAELAQSQAEQLALEAQVQQARQRLAEARRNLKNTLLISPFPGQVTETHAVPGTYVKEGDPIVTVQMVDPMLVEFEVTAADSRRYQRGDTLGVSIDTLDGRVRRLTGMVYTVDPIADVNTRTFTVSLLLRNQPENTSRDSGYSDEVARTDLIYPLNLGPVVTGDERLLVEQKAIHRIGGENHVWKINNRSWNSLSSTKDRELTVERLKVRIVSDVIPFLGTWNFVAIEFADPSAVDVDRDLITGRLDFGNGGNASPDPDRLADWKGNRVLIEQTRWMLRAGDTIRVALIPDHPATGFFVPMKAVRRENGSTFIHIVDDSTDTPRAARIPVTVTSDDSVVGDSLMLRIEPTIAGQLQKGMQVIVVGTHYLNDGTRVRIVPLQRISEGGR